MRAGARVLAEDASVIVASSVLAGFVLWLVDLLTWPSVRQPWPLVVSMSLVVANGAATALGLLLVWAIARCGPYPRVRTAVVTAAVAVAIFVAVWQSPDGMRLVAMGIAIAVSVVLAWGLTTLVDGFASERPLGKGWRPIAVLASTGGGLLALDRSFFFATEKLYSAIEGIAHLALALGVAGVLVAGAPRRSWRRVLVVLVATAASLWLGAFAFSRPLRRTIERHLPGVWDEAVYARRWLRRARRTESLGSSRPELARLSTKYRIDAPIAVDEAWRAPDEAFPKEALSERAAEWNVVVFFVDTLREDVARDASIMPHTVAWSNKSIVFTRAYSSGSSTLLTLAPMLGCRYDAKPSDPARLLVRARTAGMRTGLVIPREAFDYHRATFPSFRFDDEAVVEGKVPVAREVVARSLAWLREVHPRRFLLWIYQHDVHGWGDLAAAVVERHAREGRFQTHPGVHWHYRAAARGVDEAFFDLRRGLADLGLSERTVVVFVSDHGEALGQNDFWMHSTHLWESLIRVPFILSLPGEPSRIATTPVSTIDLFPTLARFIGVPPTPSCHGADLLSTSTERHLPILFSAMVDGRLSRVGMLSGMERKLVVDLEGADARLLQLDEASVHEHDVTHDRPDEVALRVSEIVRAPIYSLDD